MLLFRPRDLDPGVALVISKKGLSGHRGVRTVNRLYFRLHFLNRTLTLHVENLNTCADAQVLPEKRESTCLEGKCSHMLKPACAARIQVFSCVKEFSRCILTSHVASSTCEPSFVHAFFVSV